jgi:putative ABC transport system permease protein
MTLLAWLAWGEWRAQPVRNALSVAAITIGVALGFAVHLINAVALDNFTGGLNRLRGSADLQIVATGNNGFDEDLYARLIAGAGAAGPLSAIAIASPVVEREVALVDDAAVSLRVSGIDVLRAARVTPLLIGRPSNETRASKDRESDAANAAARALDWFEADAIHVPSSLLTALHKHVGDTLTVRVDDRPVVLRIAGAIDDDEASAIRPSPTNSATARRVFRASMDIAGAQWKLARLGRLTRIDLRLAEGADVAKVKAAIASLLASDAQVTSAADDLERTGDLSRAYRVNLDMLALMALFTGAFLVYSTQSLAVARRRAQLALLRVIGVTRRRVVMQVLIEGVLQGLVGGVLGLFGGVAFAAAALRFFGGDLGGGYFTKTGFDLHRLVFAAPEAALLFFVLGIGAALIGSFFPARAAARAAPAIALKSAGSDVTTGRASPWMAALLIGAGVIAALLPAIAGLPIAGYIAMALLLFGGIAAMPWIAHCLLAPLARSTRPRAIAIDLALRRLWAAPSAASVALCGIVASASLMVAMTVMIASFRHSVDDWLGQLLSADLYLRTNAGSDGLAPGEITRLRGVDGIARFDLQKVVPLVLSATRPNVSLIVRTVDTTDPERSIPLVRSTSIALDSDTIPVWVSEAMVDLYGASLGTAIALPLSTNVKQRYVVVGVWRDYARQFGSVVMRRDDYTRVTGDGRFIDAAIQLASGTTAAQATSRLRDALPDRLRDRAEFAEPSAIRKLSLDIFDRSFAVTYLLQAVAIAIGLAGVAATFSAQTLARAKEFGMLRHIGVLKRQIVGELASEGALLGVLGAVAGGVLGLAMSQVLIHVVNPQSFHWTMDTEIPWRTLMLVGIALVVASAGTAMFSGRRALAHDAVLAVREDW